MSAKRIHVYFSGRVQGVGFRYKTEELARAFKVNGWVKNLDDGRVELVLEGDSAEVLRLLDTIDNSRLSSFISSKEQIHESFQQLDTGFNIQF